MRIYLAGPMRNYPEFNFPAFDEAAARGRRMGHQIVSPAELDRELGFSVEGMKGDDAEWEQVLDFKATCLRDCRTVMECDAIALLPGWENSSGVKFEFAVAKFCKMSILDATTFEEFPHEWNQFYAAIVRTDRFVDAVH